MPPFGAVWSPGLSRRGAQSGVVSEAGGELQVSAGLVLTLPQLEGTVVDKSEEKLSNHSLSPSVSVAHTHTHTYVCLLRSHTSLPL